MEQVVEVIENDDEINVDKQEEVKRMSFKALKYILCNFFDK